MRWLRLGWDTWDDMCDFAEVGTMGAVWDGHAKSSGNMGPGSQIQLYYWNGDGIELAREGDYMIRRDDGTLDHCRRGALRAALRLVSALIVSAMLTVPVGAVGSAGTSAADGWLWYDTPIVELWWVSVLSLGSFYLGLSSAVGAR